MFNFNFIYWQNYFLFTNYILLFFFLLFFKKTQKQNLKKERKEKKEQSKQEIETKTNKKIKNYDEKFSIINFISSFGNHFLRWWTFYFTQTQHEKEKKWEREEHFLWRKFYDFSSQNKTYSTKINTKTCIDEFLDCI